MGKQLIEQLLSALDKMEWPGSEETTVQGETAYRFGLDKAASFQGDPQTLGAALRTFQSGRSRPFAYAGIAYTLIIAAREADDSYDRPALVAALEWLEKAQALAPEVLDINVIEAFIYIYENRFEDARLVLDYLSAENPHNVFLLKAEIAYHQRQGHVEEAIYAYQRAIERATTPPERLTLQQQLGDCYLEFGRINEALTIYEESIHFNRNSPHLWHKMAIIHYRLENYQESARCNQRTLALTTFPEAEKLKDLLRQKLGTGILGRIFGR